MAKIDVRPALNFVRLPVDEGLADCWAFVGAVLVSIGIVSLTIGALL